MNNIIDLLKEDLTLQKKKLDDLKAWGSDTILINNQNDVIAGIEKEIQNMREKA